jgi:hypothetical protein
MGDKAASIELNGGERTHLIVWLGRKEGVNLAFMRTAFKLVDRLELNEVEKAEIGLVQGGGNIMWQNGDRACKTVELSLEECRILRQAVSDKSWPVARPVMAMLEKLEGLPE